MLLSTRNLGIFQVRIKNMITHYNDFCNNFYVHPLLFEKILMLRLYEQMITQNNNEPYFYFIHLPHIIESKNFDNFQVPTKTTT